MKRPILACLLLLVALGAPAPGTRADSNLTGDPLLDRSADRILERKPVTSRGRTHGEVRVVMRGDALVVQTLLSTKVLKRVVAGIRERELESWPPGSEGHTAALAYVEALEAAAKAAAAAPARMQPGGGAPGAAGPRDRRRSLLIEFILSATHQAAIIAHPDLGEDPNANLTLENVANERRLDLPRPYIKRDIQLIAKDRALTLPTPE